MSLSKKLKSLLFEKKITLTELSKRSGVSIPTLHRMVEGKTKHPNDKALKAVSEYFEVTVNELTNLEYGNEIKNISPSLIHVPVLNWKNLESFPDQEQSQTSVLVSNVNKNSFAVKMPDHSMEPFIFKDSLLIFDPTLKITDRCYVIVKINELNIFVVRQVLIDLNNIFIKAINADILSSSLRKLQNEDKILGKLVEIRKIVEEA